MKTNKPEQNELIFDEKADTVTRDLLMNSYYQRSHIEEDKTLNLDVE
ncbi:hypothetical protein MM300_03375 [Evansella sp. LMS18]|nr:hypothetical protein [Evansella sp. LMS18]UTR11385.1 hypothetical protein MM300_03375 [Evansella sp. LMS18]